jgi:hypothetical protein
MPVWDRSKAAKSLPSSDRLPSDVLADLTFEWPSLWTWLVIKLSVFCVTGVIAIASLAGCSTAPSTDYGKVDLVEVSGVVTLDDQPLPGAVVTFEAPDGQFSFGETDGDGRYVLLFDSAGKTGVTPGEKIVRISTTRKILGLNADESEGEAPAGESVGEGDSATKPTLELVPEKFNKNSELKADVSHDKTTFNFDLSSQ